MRALKIIIFVLAISAVCLAFAGSIKGSLVCDLLSQFRLVYCLALIVFTATLAMARAFRLTALCFALLLIVSFPLLALYIPRTVQAEERLVSILNFNSEFQQNDHYELFDKVVVTYQPDVIALVEINKKWIDNLEQMAKSYPYQKIAHSGAGMALFSKYPIESCSVRFFGESHHPRILASIFANGKHINLIVVHPTTPQSEAKYRERNQEFALIGSEMDKLTSPKIIVGDLNCGPWSPEFKALLAHGLNDSEKGFGPQPSWPARTGRVIQSFAIPPLIPIDHVLVSDDICVVKRIAGPAVQSDHLPVYVQLKSAKPISN